MVNCFFANSNADCATTMMIVQSRRMKTFIAFFILSLLCCFASAYQGRRSLVTKPHKLKCPNLANCSKLVNVTATPEHESLFLRGHNDIRSMIANGGVKLNNLTWDDDLAAYAQDWIFFLQNKACNDTYENLNNTDVANFTTGTVGTPKSVYIRNETKGVLIGENLLYSQLSQYARAKKSRFFRTDWPYRVVSFWYNSQRNKYDFVTKNCTEPGRCDQYLQVVSNFSRKVGCTYADCEFAFNQRQVPKANVTFKIVFCNYFPAGVIRGINPY